MTQLIAPVIAIIILFFLPESPEYWTNRNKEKVKLQKHSTQTLFSNMILKFQRAIKAHKFYKGSIAALEQAEFLQKLKVAEEVEEKVENTYDEIESDSKLCLRDFCNYFSHFIDDFEKKNSSNFVCRRLKMLYHSLCLHFSYAACKKSILHYIHWIHIVRLQWNIGDSQLCNRYIYENGLLNLTERLLNFSFCYSNSSQFHVFEYRGSI